jgi:hypothetical protein
MCFPLPSSAHIIPIVFRKNYKTMGMAHSKFKECSAQELLNGKTPVRTIDLTPKFQTTFWTRVTARIISYDTTPHHS